MTINLTFAPETERELRERAAASGQTVEGFICGLVEREVVARGGAGKGPERHGAGVSDEVLEPLRREFEESGMSEEDLTQFLTGIRDEVRREKRARSAS